jgi:ATP-dependent helicase/nuclease subunit B
MVTVQQAQRQAPSGSRALSAWQTVIEDTDEIDDRVGQFVQWLLTAPVALVDRVADTLDTVLATYRNVGLPATKTLDSPDLEWTERETQAITRLRAVIEDLEERYQRRLDTGVCQQSWDAVASLLQESVTQRPGERAHANATAIDVFEASGCWGLDRPFVVAVGLVAGLWPRDDSPSAFGPKLQAAIIDGSGPAATLVPHMSWTTGPDRDQFAATLRVPTAGLVVTRHTATLDGETRHRSPLLDAISTEQVDEQARRHLVGPDRQVPAAIEEMLPPAEPANQQGSVQRRAATDGDRDDDD